jgi:circadian clock protein KaiB
MVGRGPKICFRLYVAGEAPNSQRALANLRALCLAHLADRHQIDVVDVLERPEQALDNQIYFTPQLVVASPTPVRTVIGDLSDTAVILRVLQAIDGL